MALPMDSCGAEELEALLLPTPSSSRPGAEVLPLSTLPPTLAVLTEKDMALGLLQTAVAQLLPQPPVSIPEEKLLNQLLEVQDSLLERPQLPYRWVSYPSPAPLFPELLPHIQPPVFPGVARGGPGKEARAWAACACTRGRGPALPGTPGAT